MAVPAGGCHAVSADGKTTLPSVTEKETSLDRGLEDKSSGSPADKASTGVHHLYLADLGTGELVPQTLMTMCFVYSSL